jgi:hypothetical protein
LQGSVLVGYDTVSSGGGRNVGYQSHNDKTSQPRRSESSATTLWHPEISPNCYFPKQVPDCVFFLRKMFFLMLKLSCWTFEHYTKVKLHIVNECSLYLAPASCSSGQQIPFSVSPATLGFGLNWSTFGLNCPHLASDGPHIIQNHCSVILVHKPKTSLLNFCMHFMLLKPEWLSRYTD